MSVRDGQSTRARMPSNVKRVGGGFAPPKDLVSNKTTMHRPNMDMLKNNLIHSTLDINGEGVS